jgi:hypothetical protein
MLRKRTFGCFGLWLGATLRGPRTVPWVDVLPFQRRGRRRASMLVVGSRHDDDIVIGPNRVRIDTPRKHPDDDRVKELTDVDSKATAQAHPQSIKSKKSTTCICYKSIVQNVLYRILPDYRDTGSDTVFLEAKHEQNQMGRGAPITDGASLNVRKGKSRDDGKEYKSRMTPSDERYPAYSHQEL